ncbi:THEM6 [Branchiostoma lanceolatum]|uniref:Protein THEM6 n=1 Tax=Branchiostoma lanceolatum TaxID=7740 RepID=A0A8K0EW19_BRALA|nr:THEM6 [Branchiostoma lanceolatum]
MATVWLLVALLAPFAFFDVWYFLNGFITWMVARLQKTIRKKGVLEDVVTYGLVTTTDLGFGFHKNNARFSRKCDFARFQLSESTGIWDSLAKLGGVTTVGASTIRFRRSLQFLEPFRVLCWDDKAFYVEQRLESLRDNFICAIVYCKQTMIRTSPSKVVETMCGEPMASPEFPSEITTWIEMNNISSENLRKCL